MVNCRSDTSSSSTTTTTTTTSASSSNAAAVTTEGTNSWMKQKQIKEEDNSSDEWQKELHSIQSMLTQEDLQESSTTSSLKSNHATTTATTTSKTVGITAAAVSIIGITIGLQFPFLFPKSAPYMATPGRKVRDALDFLIKNNMNVHGEKTTNGLKQQQQRQQQLLRPIFIDMGSGDGQAVYEAGKLGYDSIGIEYNWTLYMFSLLRRQLFWPSEIKQRTSFVRQDFHSYNLRHANTIMIFTIPRTMPVLGTKIQTEYLPGTNILAYRFGIPLLVTDEKQHTDDNDREFLLTKTNLGDGDIRNDNKTSDIRLNADLIYDREDMRIYRMK
jgi:hypothetical protein